MLVVVFVWLMTSVSGVAHQKGWKQLAFNKTSMWGGAPSPLPLPVSPPPACLPCHTICFNIILSLLSCLKTGRRIFFTKPKPSHLKPFNGCPCTLSQNKVQTPLLTVLASLLLTCSTSFGGNTEKLHKVPWALEALTLLYPHIDFFFPWFNCQVNS